MVAGGEGRQGPGVVQGGPFTRRDPATGKESCLDLFIVSRELLPFVSKLTIDSGREIQCGIFGADMKVSLLNDGPVTIIIDSKNKE